MALSEKEKTTQLVKVLKAHEGLEELDTPKGFLLTGPPGTGKRCVSLVLTLFAEPRELILLRIPQSPDGPLLSIASSTTQSAISLSCVLAVSVSISKPINSRNLRTCKMLTLPVLAQVHQALETQRLDNEEEERQANELFQKGGGGGYPWSRKEEMKARAISKGWQSVFAGGRSASDPGLNTREFVLARVALDLIKTQGWLLAFDEVQLVDIAGAGLVSRVLSWYWRLGGVVVATSNRVPEGESPHSWSLHTAADDLSIRSDLYKQGIQRSTLSPFLSALSHRSPVIELISPNDYRLIARSQHPLTPETDAETPGEHGTEEAWKRWGTRSRAWFVKGEEKEYENALNWVIGVEEGKIQGEARELSVYGRKLKVPWSNGGVARFTFKELCEKALGPADYITLGSEFVSFSLSSLIFALSAQAPLSLQHTIILDNIPILPLNAKNEARRLITLLDALCKLPTLPRLSDDSD